MGRWRPPRPKSSAYITAAGARALKDELRELWKVERPKVTEVVHEAAKNGDRSENGDYIYGKKRLREIDSRVRFLTKRLESLTIVDRLPDDQSRVLFGAWVTLEDDNGKERCYQIVGPDEFDVSAGKISMDSPLAQAMLKKQVDDEIMVHGAETEQVYYISAIEYKPYA
ncbi:transcription elongation factor GreB [uncultured Gilvimarinus sp.]|uniref:transcription elongation factor GreB n=1 Tax=uncultured Gilvimarinus sp. TaxID=1689143 RepID=UPI0030DDC3BC